MKDPINSHRDHDKRMDEIFGKIAKFFSSSNDGNDYQARVSRTGKPINLSSSEKKQIQTQRDLSYQANIEKYKAGYLLNPDTCGKYYVPVQKKDKQNSKQKKTSYRKPRIQIIPNGGIMIDQDKIIKNYSELYIENTVNGVGMGAYRKINVRDFVCYDLEEDVYGISWLLDSSASYVAEKISGKLQANKSRQSINFDGNWITGKFQGKISGSQALNRLKPLPSKSEISDKFLKLQDLIKETKNNFDLKLSLEDFNQMNRIVRESENEKLKNLFTDILKIKNYLLNFQVNRGMGSSSYVTSNEIYRIKSQIDNNENVDEIMSDIQELTKEFKIINSKINNFWEAYKNAISGNKNEPEKEKLPKFKKKR